MGQVEEAKLSDKYSTKIVQGNEEMHLLKWNNMKELIKKQNRVISNLHIHLIGSSFSHFQFWSLILIFTWFRGTGFKIPKPTSINWAIKMETNYLIIQNTLSLQQNKKNWKFLYVLHPNASQKQYEEAVSSGKIIKWHGRLILS